MEVSVHRTVRIFASHRKDPQTLEFAVVTAEGEIHEFTLFSDEVLEIQAVEGSVWGAALDWLEERKHG